MSLHVITVLYILSVHLLLLYILLEGFYIWENGYHFIHLFVA